MPTWGDALGLLQLSPGQVMGLQSMGEPSGEIVPGASIQPLLAIVQAGGPNPRAPLPDPNKLTRQQWEKVPLLYAELSPRQRELVPAFLEAYPYVVPPKEAPRFLARLFNTSEGIHRSPGYLQKMREMGRPVVIDRTYRTATVSFGWQLQGEGRIWGQEVHLPLSLPDDRRARTKVEVAGPPGSLSGQDIPAAAPN